MQIGVQISAKLSVCWTDRTRLLYGAMESPDALRQRVHREVQLKSRLCLAAMASVAGGDQGRA
jgi:hypothetical protein